ncbi:MAG TPA: cyclopropane mycolic acid synthase family methyltransferase [Pirellulaceae bacterium]|nr:cyclopropane mycolic acid synthase family methyltransferase [Pirellulaceae bacterium]
MSQLQPFYEQVQAHYDLSNDFFELFLDRSLTYSCAYFERDDMSLEEAQRAKIDLALGKCDLQPGQRLLDIGCGWGSAVARAAEKHGASCVGLTLSRRQFEYALRRLRHLEGLAQVRLQGWEEFDEPVDRIVSIGAFEHFRHERYPEFFARCYRLLPAGAPMLLHSIVYPEDEVFGQPGMALTYDDVLFLKFIAKRIFPGGQLTRGSVVCRYAEAAGFRVTRQHSLQPHYARTLEAWADNLAASRERAIELTSEETYDTYRHYLTGCAHYFRSGKIDVVQFTLRKP